MLEYESLQNQLYNSQFESKKFEKLVSDMTERSDTQNQFLNSRDETISEELNSAAELAEKQNALIVTLEAKVCWRRCMCIYVYMYVFILNVLCV